ncbi:MAG TPA: hypothetical protein VFA49_06520, partial [Chloroflexota bacterium]|nr:hypothetical protein [Chloroflexota bacterium]
MARIPGQRRLLPLVAAGLLAGVLACSPSQFTGGGSGQGNRRLTPPPETPRPGTPGPSVQGTPVAGGPVRLRGQGLTSGDLYVAYRAMLDNYVDPINNSQLVQAAQDSLMQGLEN